MGTGTNSFWPYSGEDKGESKSYPELLEDWGVRCTALLRWSDEHFWSWPDTKVLRCHKEDRSARSECELKRKPLRRLSSGWPVVSPGFFAVLHLSLSICWPLPFTLIASSWGFWSFWEFGTFGACIVLGTSPHLLVINEGPSWDDNDGPEFPSFGKSHCCDFLFWNQKHIFLTENKLLKK